MVKIIENKRIHKAVGQALRRRRKTKALTQSKLADHVGVSFQQIQKYEKGIDRVTVVRLLQFAEIMNLSPLFLLADIIKEVDRHSRVDTRKGQ